MYCPAIGSWTLSKRASLALAAATSISKHTRNLIVNGLDLQGLNIAEWHQMKQNSKENLAEVGIEPTTSGLQCEE